MNRINIYVVRHGESAVNVLKDRVGQAPDTPLTEKGFNQAKLLGQSFRNRKIRLDHIFASTFKRAKDTATTFAESYKFDKEIIFSEDLVEYNAGDWIGKGRNEIFAEPKNAIQIATLNMGFQYPNGDTLNKVERRVSGWVEETIVHSENILKELENRDVNICLFSHGQAIKCLLHYVMGFDQSMIWKIQINNTSVCHLSYTKMLGWRINGLNDTSHLLSSNACN